MEKMLEELALDKIKYYQCICENGHYTLQYDNLLETCKECGSKIEFSNFVDCAKHLGLCDHLTFVKDESGKVIIPKIGFCEAMEDKWVFDFDGVKTENNDFVLAKNAAMMYHSLNAKQVAHIILTSTPHAIKYKYSKFSVYFILNLLRYETII